MNVSSLLHSYSQQSVTDVRRPGLSSAGAHTNTAQYNDTVMISSAAHRASELAHLQAPAWMSQYQPEYTNLSDSDALISEGKQYVALANQLSSNNAGSEKNKQALASYQENSMNATQHRRRLDEFYQRHQQEHQEYSQYVNHAYKQALINAGIDTQQNDKASLLSNAEINQVVHNDFKEALFSNPRAVELMNVLQISAQPSFNK